MRTRGLSGLHAVVCALALGGHAVAAEKGVAEPAKPPEATGSIKRPAPSSNVEPFRSSEAPLTLGECIRRALANGFDLEVQRHELAITQDDLPIARSAFHPVIIADTARSADRTARDAAFPNLRSNGLTSSAGITQRLWTGTSVTMGSNLDRFASNQPVTIINGTTLTTTENSLSYSSGLVLGVTQPLLKGFGSVNTIPIRQAELGINIAERSYEDRALEVIRATEAAYYLLTGARDQLLVFRTSQQLAERLLKEAQARHAAGMAMKIDLLEAQVGIANARLNVLQAENVVHSSEDALLAQIGRFEFDAPLGPTVVDDVLLEAPPTVQASYARALDHQPAILNARSALELSRLQLALAKDDLKPIVDLDVSLGVTGDDTTRSNAFADTFEPERSSWQVGLNVTYPLGRVGEKARFRQATHALTRDELAVHKLEQDVLVSVREAIRNVATNRESMKIAALASNLAQEQYEAERIRYRAGLSTGRRVLEAQEDLESARVAELQAKLNLRTSYSTLFRIEGSSLERYGVGLDTQPR